MGADREDEAGILAAIAQRLQRHGSRQRIQAGPAISLGHRQAGEAHCSARVPQVAAEDLVPIALPDVAVELLPSKAMNLIAQDALLVAQPKIHYSASLSL